MSIDYSPHTIGPQAVKELTPLATGHLLRRFAATVFSYPVPGTNSPSLLPDPYRLVLIASFCIICRISDDQIEQATVVRLDDFVPDSFLREIKTRIPEETELYWIAQVGDVSTLRSAFIDAFRFGKLRLVHSQGESLVLEWPYYRLSMCVDLGSTSPTIKAYQPD